MLFPLLFCLLPAALNDMVTPGSPRRAFVGPEASEKDRAL